MPRACCACACRSARHEAHVALEAGAGLCAATLSDTCTCVLRHDGAGLLRCAMRPCGLGLRAMTARSIHAAADRGSCSNPDRAGWRAPTRVTMLWLLCEHTARVAAPRMSCKLRFGSIGGCKSHSGVARPCSELPGIRGPKAFFLFIFIHIAFLLLYLYI